MLSPTVSLPPAISGRPHTPLIHARRLARVALLVVPLTVAACKDGIDPIAPPVRVSYDALETRREGPIVLRGTIITPTDVMKHGYIAIMNGRIVSVSVKQPDIPGAVVVNTDGIILPGFVD